MFRTNLKEKYSFLTDYFENAMSNKDKNLTHSVIFYGNDLETQYEFANEIARLLNCQRDKKSDCTCLSCNWARENSHPAIMTVSKYDNKPADDDTKTGISIKQIRAIINSLLITSDYYRVFIFCDKNENGDILGLNENNFNNVCVNALLKSIEEPPKNTMFIFLTKDKTDLIETIISRSQSFFIPSFKQENRNFDLIQEIFQDYPNLNREKSFDIAKELNDLSKQEGIDNVLNQMQNYILNCAENNFEHISKFVNDITFVEEAKEQNRLKMLSLNVFENLILNITK